MNDIRAELTSLLCKSKSLPVLFAGSGLSMRYLGSPTWKDLLAVFAEECGRPISYYLGRAENDLPQVASLLANDFYDVWYDTPKYSNSRADFEDKVTSKADPLKYEICNLLGSLEQVGNADLEIASLREAHIHAIVTTNWDTFLESSFPDFDVYAGQQDILFAATQGIGENYKIHGSISNPSSLVLTSEDYEAYWKRNPYLVAKLMTLFVEHPIIFLGYSLSDNHIKKLLGELISCLTPDQLAVLNERLIFVRRGTDSQEPTLKQAPMTIEGHTIQIYEYTTSNFSDVYDATAALPQYFSTKLLRKIKRNVYELTVTTEPRGMIHVVEFDKEANLDDVEVVIGVGTMSKLGEKGYSAYTRLELVESMLRNKPLLGSDAIVKRLLPTLFSNAKWCPVFYPLAHAGVLNERMRPSADLKLPKNARARVEGDPALMPYFKSADGERFTSLLAHSRDQAYDQALDAEYEIDDVIALREFILAQIDGEDSLSTINAKLACKYDELVYGGAFGGDVDELHRSLGITESQIRQRIT